MRPSDPLDCCWQTSLTLKEQCFLQKLFSAFPRGWPGVGLLLLRGLVSFTLAAEAAAYTSTAKMSVVGWIVVALSLASAACLLAGFMTPVAAIAVTAGASAFALSGPLPATIELVVLGIAIALLGPGAFSVDARMFGRREILLPGSRTPKQ